MANNMHRRFFAIGPGGIGCSCCYPAAGKARVKVERTFKRRERANAKNDMRKEMLDQ